MKHARLLPSTCPTLGLTFPKNSVHNTSISEFSLPFAGRQPLEAAAWPALTQLANLQGFAQLVGRELNQARRFSTRPAVLLIDVDVHEPLGAPVHRDAYAEALLLALGQRLRCRVRGSDVVARIGAQRFGVVLQNVERANVYVIQQRLQQVLSGAYEVAPRPMYARLSSGIAKCECARMGAAELTRAAELALCEGLVLQKNSSSRSPGPGC